MTRFAHIFPILLLITLALLFFWKLAFTDMILARGDTYAYFYPYWDVRNAAFRAGELPLWTPDIFMGAPLLANPQLGTFYPPNWLTTPFYAPDAVRYSILLHVVWAAAGVFVLFRQTITKNLIPAFLAASVFALSGYIGAHVEQINQLQGLAWMPWLFYFFHSALTAQRRGLWAIVLAIGLALQIFSGHTQTVFNTGVGLGIYAIVYGLLDIWDNRASHNLPLQMIRKIGFPLLMLTFAAIGTVLLAVPQILPTLELTGMSNRGGGFTGQAATAFSLPPTYLGRALLPSYDGQLFGEYVGYVGVIALGLAILAMISPINALFDGRVTDPPLHNDAEIFNRNRIIWMVLAVIGLTFAIGRFNPLYWQLAELPGFNLFRVPARWLSLFVLAVSILAGMGLELLQTQKIGYKRIIAVAAPLLVLMLMGRFVLVEQVDIVGSAVPTQTTLIMWGIGLVVFMVIGFLATQTPPLNPLAVEGEGKHKTLLPNVIKRGLSGEIIILTLVILELFLASRVLPYNDLTPRDVYEGQRFTISQLLAYQDEQTPPGRVLSISQLYFDPGDKARLLQHYQQMGMDEQAIQTAFTAVKRQEMLFPNLSMTWGIPSIDGYEGGILPTIYYSQFTSLLLPEGTPRTIDGRLGELLAQRECRGACIPDLRWLRMTDTRYIITDKVYDVWYEGIRFDTTFPEAVIPQLFTIVYRPIEFQGDQIQILYQQNDTPPYLTFIEENSFSHPELAETFDIDDGLSLAVYRLVNQNHPQRIFVQGVDDVTKVYAATLVDSRTGDFAQLSVEGWRRVLSSDIKIYETSSNSRAYFAENTQILPDDWQGHEDALVALRNCEDEICTVLHGADAISSETSENDTIHFVQYTPTRIELTTSIEAEAYLILNDAYYPGWRATVKGEETPIYRANVMFRAVRVPAGESTVVFEFVPMLWYWSMAFGAMMWVIAIIGGIWLWRRRRVASS